MDLSIKDDLLCKQCEARLASWEVRARISLIHLMLKYKYSDEFIMVSSTGVSTRYHEGPLFIIDKPSTDKFCTSIAPT